MGTRLLLQRFALTCGFCAALATVPWGPFIGSAALAEVRNPKGVAVIVGNRDYEHRDVPDVAFAHRDAAAFRSYVVDVLGFDPENVIDLRDATRRKLYDAFGTRSDPRSDLWSYLDPEGGSDVVVFYSGHGVPGEKDKRGYLLPVDGDPKAAEDDGYPIDLLYRNMGKLLEARTVRVYLDACFSGGSHEGGLIGAASPVYVPPALPEGLPEKLTSLTAATGKQIAAWHGLFTHHLLDALYGKSDGDKDGKVTAGEAKAYLDHHMTRAARASADPECEPERRAGCSAGVGGGGMFSASFDSWQGERQGEGRSTSTSVYGPRGGGKRSWSGANREGSGSAGSGIDGFGSGLCGWSVRSEDAEGDSVMAESEGVGGDGLFDYGAGGGVAGDGSRGRRSRTGEACGGGA